MALSRTKRSPLPPIPFAITGIKAFYQANGNTLDALNNANGNPQGSLTYGTGVYGPAFNLDGTTAYVQIPYVSALASTTTETLMAWIYLAQLPGAGTTYHIFGQSTNANDNDLLIGFSVTNTLQFYGFPSASAVSASSAMVPLVWTHVAISCNSVANARNLYINGILVGSSTCSARANSTNDWSIGESLVFTGRKFKGLIDDVRMYNIALTQTQIKQAAFGTLSLTKPRRTKVTQRPVTASLKMMYKGNGNVLDSTGLTAATFNVSAQYGTGLLGQAFNFDGTNYVTITYNGNLTTTSFQTLSCWFKLASSPGVWTVFAQSTNANDNDLLFNGATLQYYGFGASPMNCTTSFSTLQWYHCAVVIDGPGNSKKFYINGQPAGSAGAATRSNSTNNWSIGESLVFTGRKFRGLIADVRMYNVALTQAQVQQIFTSSTPLYD